MNTQQEKSTDEQPSIHYETHFHGPVTGQVHTGSGDINRFDSDTLPEQEKVTDMYDISMSLVHPDTKHPWSRLFDVASLRKLLEVSLNSGQLIDLCQSYFPTVYQDFAEGMTARQQRRLLLEHCEHHNQLQLLVNRIKMVNPERYREYFPHLIKPITDQFLADNEANRIQAAKSLGRLRQPDVLPIIEEQLFKQDDPGVRYWLAIAIGHIGGSEAQATLQRITSQLEKQSTDPYTMLGIEDARKMIEVNKARGGVQT